MARAATDRLKVNAPLGLRPSLENCRLGDLNVDPAYQRSIDNGSSVSLIRRIAMFWDWSLFHPLAVARRADESLWVVDGQHRLAAARLRRDLYDLPCVVSRYASQADEAASFVAMNVQRRALSKLDLFKAAVAGADSEASAIARALSGAGLSLAPHTNHTAWKPGMLANVGGIEASWRRHGERVTSLALQAMAKALDGQVLRYAGTLFPGIVAVVAQETGGGKRAFDPAMWDMFIEMVAEGGQETWRGDMMKLRGEEPNLKYGAAMERVFLQAWGDLTAELVEAA